MSQNLTSKQEAFAQHYALHGKTVEAYKAAGYSWKRMKNNTLAVKASELLAHGKVSVRVAELKERIKERAEHVFDITADKIVQELAAIGFANMKDYLRVDLDGQPTVDFTSLQRHQWAAIGEVTIEDIETGQRTGRRTKFKLLDKKGALVELGKHVGLFTEKHEHKHSFVEDANVELDSWLDQHIARAREASGTAGAAKATRHTH